MTTAQIGFLQEVDIHYGIMNNMIFQIGQQKKENLEQLNNTLG